MALYFAINNRISLADNALSLVCHNMFYGFFRSLFCEWHLYNTGKLNRYFDVIYTCYLSYMYAGL